jgi:hypothetical protein
MKHPSTPAIDDNAKLITRATHVKEIKHQCTHTSVLPMNGLHPLRNPSLEAFK